MATMRAARSRAAATLTLIAAAALTVPAAHADDYPSRPIEMIVTWGPGGGADQTGRRIGKLVEPILKVSMPVENVAGSAGVTGLTKLLNGQPEGYQVGIVTADTYALLAESKPQRWTLKDLDVIAVLIVQQSGFFTKADGELKTWADVEKKAQSTELKVAVTGFGTPDDLAVELLKKRGLKLNSVPMPKPGERYAAVVGGHADLLYEQAGDIRSFIDGKQIVPVLFLADAKVSQFPNVPVTKDIGLSLKLDQFRTIVAKAGTPSERLAKLSAAVEQAAKSDDYRKFLDDQWADPASVVVGPAAAKYVADAIEDLRKLK